MIKRLFITITIEIDTNVEYHISLTLGFRLINRKILNQLLTNEIDFCAN